MTACLLLLLLLFLCCQTTVGSSFHSRDNVLQLWQGCLFQFLRVRHGNIRPTYTFHGRIQVVKGVRFHDHGGNFRSDSMLRPSLFQGDTTSSFLNTAQNGIPIQRTNRQEINNLTRNSLASQDFGSFQGEADLFRVRNDGDIGSFSFDFGLANFHDKVLGLFLVCHGKGDSVHEFMFQDQDGVGVPNGGLDESLGIRRGVGRHHLDSRHTSIPGSKALRVLGCCSRTVSIGSPKDNRTGQIAAAHVKLFGGRVDDLINRLQGKIPRHEFHNGLEIVKGTSHGHTGESGFGDGSVNDSLFAVFLVQSLGDLVSALILSNFFTHDVDGLVAFHFLVDTFANGFSHRDILGGKGAAEDCSVPPTTTCTAQSSNISH
mmetsp:Transcript_104697/g.293462  ORF Transcript_104697/g.293462 Transcript_104697/m.293462 type:complete len:373 (-) Transcript_104697:109-1227(-)